MVEDINYQLHKSYSGKLPEEITVLAHEVDLLDNYEMLLTKYNDKYAKMIVINELDRTEKNEPEYIISEIGTDITIKSISHHIPQRERLLNSITTIEDGFIVVDRGIERRIQDWIEKKGAIDELHSDEISQLKGNTLVWNTDTDIKMYHKKITTDEIRNSGLDDREYDFIADIDIHY